MKITNNENYTLYEKKDETGKINVTVYTVFPGIQLIFSELHIQSCTFEEVEDLSENMIEITYCSEGCVECIVNDECLYIEKGNLAIGRLISVLNVKYFPIHHFHGISIRIDAEYAPENLSCFLKDIDVEPYALIRKFCENQSCFVIRSNSTIDRIFAEMDFVSGKTEKGYLKLKVLELLLFLNGFDLKETEAELHIYSKTQATLVKQVVKYLMEHMEKHITIEQLADHFHISGTHIKNTFKDVYGCSCYSYVRTLKMQSAAYMLETTDKSILEIAGEHGYENGSKFSNAFKSIMGISPSEYRKKKCKIE